MQNKSAKWMTRNFSAQLRARALTLLTLRGADAHRRNGHVQLARQRTRGGNGAGARTGGGMRASPHRGGSPATGGIPTEPDAAHGRMRRAPYAARASGGGVTAARKRPRARANRGGERPRSRAPSAQRRGPRCDRTRTQSNDCGAGRAQCGTAHFARAYRWGGGPRTLTGAAHTPPHTRTAHT